MREYIAVATDKDKRSLWNGHFGMAPIYSVFDYEGNLVQQRENPYAKGDKHHDDPALIAEFLSDVETFIARRIGEKSRRRLIEEFDIEPVLVDFNNIYDAVGYFIEARKNVDVFDRCHERYEEWFDKYSAVYQSELNMLKDVVPSEGKGIEIGVGSGRFAAPLGIKEGVEPSEEMAKIAEKRGIRVHRAYAEKLPLPNETYDFALIAVTICFVKDPLKTLEETARILKKGGRVIVAIVDRETPIGRSYLRKKEKGLFYRNANFFSSEEIRDMLQKSGFRVEGAYQTLFGESIRKIKEIQPYKPGYGEGGFVAIVGVKDE